MSAKTQKNFSIQVVTPKKVKLHLGCGKRHLPGYIHIDLASYPHIDHRQDIRRLPRFKKNSVDCIYSSHALEYFDRMEVLDVLREWRRVLKKGGTLRLAVPDFATLTRVYQKTNKLDLVLGPLFGRWPTKLNHLVLYHKTVYDFSSLKQILKTLGFHNIQRWDWRKVFKDELAGFDDYSQAYYPHMDKKHGILTSLNVQAKK